MTVESHLREIIAPVLLETPDQIKIEVGTRFLEFANEYPRPTRSLHPAKNIIEVMDLIKKAIKDYEERQHITTQGKALVIYQNPDARLVNGNEMAFLGLDFDNIIDQVSSEENVLLDNPGLIITMAISKRTSGMFAQGRPMQNPVKNKKFIVREIIEDPEHPGYKRAILGYFYDNILCLTVWARTNLLALQKMLWLEDIMDEYGWFFGYRGVNRLIYDSHGNDLVSNLNNNKYYGRQINYFVRTEKIKNISQKTLEEILIKASIANY